MEPFAQGAWCGRREEALSRWPPQRRAEPPSFVVARRRHPGPGPSRPEKWPFFRTECIFMARRPGICAFFRTEPRFFAPHPGKCLFFRTKRVFVTRRPGICAFFRTGRSAPGGEGAPQAV